MVSFLNLYLYDFHLHTQESNKSYHLVKSTKIIRNCSKGGGVWWMVGRFIIDMREGVLQSQTKTDEYTHANKNTSDQW